MEVQHSDALENYLVEIYRQQKDRSYSRVKDIADRLNRKHSSIIIALRKLKEQGLLEYEKHHYLVLTRKGLEKAQELFARRQVTIDFLVDLLNVPLHEAEEISCRLEHLDYDGFWIQFKTLKAFLEKNPNLVETLHKGSENRESL